MKVIVNLILCCFLISSSTAQIELPAERWQDDLRFLQKTVHRDYPFLFKKITADEFDAKVEELYQSIPELSEHEVVTGLARIVASFGYGHTAIGMRESPFKYHKLPLNLYHFSDGIYIEGVHKDHEQVLGAKLLEISGVPVEQALAAIRPVVPAENDQYFKAHGLTYVCIPEVLHAQGVTRELDNAITLTLQRDGKIFKHAITAVDAKQFPIRYGLTTNGSGWVTVREPGKVPLYLKDLDKLYFFEYLPDQKTVYIRHSQIQDDPAESIPAFYNRVFDFVENNDVQRLVLDVRLNGGGNNYKNKPIVTGIIRCKKIDQPGKFFVIIGRRTFSACQNLVNELDNYTNAIFVGEPTSENINFYGDNRTVVLPNSKLPAYLSFAWWQDKPQWEGEPWLAPHLAVDMSFDEYRSNQDPVLAAALSFSADHFILDPIAYFTELFQSQQFKKLEAEAARMVKDPSYRFFDFEAEFNRVGYDLMQRDQLEPAIYVFQQNNKLFPGSANTWDSLGEAYWKANQIDKAIEHYNKAIELDPDGAVGNNARNMLKQVESSRDQPDKDNGHPK